MKSHQKKEWCEVSHPTQLQSLVMKRVASSSLRDGDGIGAVQPMMILRIFAEEVVWYLETMLRE